MSQAELDAPATAKRSPGLPERSAETLYEKCMALARNLWWSWHPEVVNLFRDLDPIRWRQLDHNPISLLAEFTPQYLDFYTEMAVKYHVNIIGGSQFVMEDEALYNVSYLFRRDGTLEKQEKIHITPSERKWWGVTPGRKVNVFETDCGTVAILICYDIEFPELVRIAAAKGAQIVFVPFNTDTRHGYLRVRNCAMARCVENHVYVAVAGCTGNLPFVENSDIHYAQSAIFTPADAEFARDAIAAESNANIETLIIHDVDVEQLRRHKETGSVQNWNDRRTDLYKVVYQEDGHEFSV